MTSNDNWKKPRSRREYLTPNEIEIIRKGYEAGTPALRVARQLKCASRTVNKYYAKFEGREPARRKRGQVGHRFSKPTIDKPPRAPAQPNLYRSNFEPM